MPQCRYISLRSPSLIWDSDRFKQGFGSNLTLQGTVECDASIMDGARKAFGSVGATAGTRKHQTLFNDTLLIISPRYKESYSISAFGAGTFSNSRSAWTYPAFVCHSVTRKNITKTHCYAERLFLQAPIYLPSIISTGVTS